MSLPVPDSPRMVTMASEEAIFSAMATTCRMAALAPMMSLKPTSAGS